MQRTTQPVVPTRSRVEDTTFQVGCDPLRRVAGEHVEEDMVVNHHRHGVGLLVREVAILSADLRDGGVVPPVAQPLGKDLPRLGRKGRLERP